MSQVDDVFYPRPSGVMSQILLADDHELVLQGLKAVLETVPDWRVCGTALDGRKAVELAASLRPDVAVLDLGMPDLNGLEAARQIRHEASPTTEVLVLTGSDSQELFDEACAAGVRGFVLKSDDASALIAGIRAMLEGRPYVSPGVRRPISAMAARTAAAPRRRPVTVHEEPLTPREREITQLLAEGKSNWFIANLLGITVNTVETHRAHIMSKAGCSTLVELVHYAVRHLIITP